MSMTDTEHIAEQPSWQCRACRAPWPCPEAKRVLLATLSPTHLAITALIHLESAARDLPTMAVREAFERFVSWTWPENAPEARPGGSAPSDASGVRTP